jgi:hypothetical protein
MLSQLLQNNGLSAGVRRSRRFPDADSSVFADQFDQVDAKDILGAL